jgi:hypothetical protein
MRPSNRPRRSRRNVNKRKSRVLLSRKRKIRRKLCPRRKRRRKRSSKHLSPTTPSKRIAIPDSIY